MGDGNGGTIPTTLPETGFRCLRRRNVLLAFLFEQQTPPLLQRHRNDLIQHVRRDYLEVLLVSD